MKAEVMRENADNCLALAEKHKANQPARLRYMRMASAWQDLADTQDWLDGALPRSPTLQPQFNNAA